MWVSFSPATDGPFKLDAVDGNEHQARFTGTDLASAQDKRPGQMTLPLAHRTDSEEDAPQEPPSNRQDAVSSSKDESSGVDSPPFWVDCLDVGCTWPCAHHFHWRKALQFYWFPDLDHFCYQHPKLPRIQYETKIGRKGCQFCGIFFTIWQSGCDCEETGDNDHVMKSSGCRLGFAACAFRSNGQLSHVRMSWTCGEEKYELGLLTGKVVWSLYGLFNESFLTVPTP